MVFYAVVLSGIVDAAQRMLVTIAVVLFVYLYCPGTFIEVGRIVGLVIFRFIWWGRWEMKRGRGRGERG